jgi:hypothetical protein
MLVHKRKTLNVSVYKVFGTGSEDFKGFLGQHRKETKLTEEDLKATGEQSDQLNYYSAEC